MVAKHRTARPLLLVLAALVACIAQDAAGCFVLTISTGVRGRLKHISDDGSPDSPGAGRTIVVFRADEPGLRDRQPADEDKSASTRDDFLSASPDQLGPPVASAVTDADGRFQIELAPGDYALTRQDGSHYAPFRVDEGRVTSCIYTWGYRFARWGCDEPQ